MNAVNDNASGSKVVMRDVEDIRKFLLSGRALFTIKSLVSGYHYTFRFTVKEDKYADPDDAKNKKKIIFISILANGDDLIYLGLLDTSKNQVKLTTANKFKETFTCVRALNFTLNWILNHHTIPNGLAFYHHGHCGRCGKTLTNPESIERGIGPECWSKL